MKKSMFNIRVIGILLFFVISLSVLSVPSLADEVNTEDYIVKLYIFYGRGCPHCSELLNFIGDIEDKYPSLEIKEFEIYFNDDNRELFSEMSESFNTTIQGVPTVFVDDEVIVGFSPALGKKIENTINRCLLEDCGDPANKIENSDIIEVIGDSSPTEDPGKTQFKKTLTIPAVISAAAVDAINPCAFAVLVILITTILATGHRKKALFSGLAFSFAIFISYFLMGLGLYSAIQAAGLTRNFYMIVAVLAILVGLFNLKDYLWYGKWFKMEVPESWRPRMKSIIRGVTSVPGAFFVGFVVSLFLLPCTSGPYIVILGLLAQATTKNFAMLLLLLYNIIFILPMVVITVFVYLGFTTSEKVEEWRQKKLEVLHLIAGIIILLLGISMLVAIKFGII